MERNNLILDSNMNSLIENPEKRSNFISQGFLFSGFCGIIS